MTAFPAAAQRRRLLDLLAHPPVEAARLLLGTVIVRRQGRDVRAARIVETEAYLGQDDPAAHAFRGRTARTAPLWGRPGTIYVYFIYGMHYCLNFKVEREGTAGCVLIRAAEPVAGLDAAGGDRARAAVPGPGHRHVAERTPPLRPGARALLARGPGAGADRRQHAGGHPSGRGLAAALLRRGLRRRVLSSRARHVFPGGRAEVDFRHEARSFRGPGHSRCRPGAGLLLPPARARARGPDRRSRPPALLDQGAARIRPPQPGRRAGHGGRRATPGRLERGAPGRGRAALHARARHPAGLHGRARGGGPRVHAHRGEAAGRRRAPHQSRSFPSTSWSITRCRWTSSARAMRSPATRRWSSGATGSATSS